MWAGTPLFLSHISQDGRFLVAESPYACGWIDSRDIAYAGEKFVAKYRSANLAAVRRDRIPVPRGTDQIAVKIQHKDRLLTDPGAIEDVLAVENDVVPFDRADVPQQPRGTI